MFQLYQTKMSQGTQANCEQEGLTLGNLLQMTLMTVICCSWFLCNSEAREYLSRKISVRCSDSFTRNNRRVGIATTLSNSQGMSLDPKIGKYLINRKGHQYTGPPNKSHCHSHTHAFDNLSFRPNSNLTNVEI